MANSVSLEASRRRATSRVRSPGGLGHLEDVLVRDELVPTGHLHAKLLLQAPESLGRYLALESHRDFVGQDLRSHLIVAEYRRRELDRARVEQRLEPGEGALLLLRIGALHDRESLRFDQPNRAQLPKQLEHLVFSLVSIAHGKGLLDGLVGIGRRLRSSRGFFLRPAAPRRRLPWRASSGRGDWLTILSTNLSPRTPANFLYPESGRDQHAARPP